MSSPPPERTRLLQAFGLAAVISVLAALIQPWGRYALYPLSLLGTWSHEMGHGLTALILGGEFRELVLRSDLGGYAVHTATGSLTRPLVAAGGLLGPAVLGGILIQLGGRSEKGSRAALGLLVLALGLSVVIWIRPWLGFGQLAIALLALGLGLIASQASPFLELVTIQLVGIQLCLSSLSDFDYMFSKGFMRDGQFMASDTQHMAEHWFLPYWVWGALIAALSLAILAGSFYSGWVRPRR